VTLIEPYCPGCAQSVVDVYRLERLVAKQAAEIKRLQGEKEAMRSVYDAAMQWCSAAKKRWVGIWNDGYSVSCWRNASNLLAEKALFAKCEATEAAGGKG